LEEIIFKVFMRRWIVLLLVFPLAACCLTAPTSLQPPTLANKEEIETGSIEAGLPNLGIAPELTNDIWLNTTVPLRLADLRGKVILMDMWTFG
jgi:hypothetical protein